jgi:hypothetical protein
MYIIHDLKYDTYLADGTQLGRDGQKAPRWTKYRSEAKTFASLGEVKAALYVIKNIDNQDNKNAIYERY